MMNYKNIPDEQISWFTNTYIRAQKAPALVIDGSPRIFGGHPLVITGGTRSRMDKVMMNPSTLPDLLDEAITEAARLEHYEMAAMLRALLNELMLAMDDESPVKLDALIKKVKNDLL